MTWRESNSGKLLFVDRENSRDLGVVALDRRRVPPEERGDATRGGAAVVRRLEGDVRAPNEQVAERACELAVHGPPYLAHPVRQAGHDLGAQLHGALAQRVDVSRVVGQGTRVVG